MFLKHQKCIALDSSLQQMLFAVLRDLLGNVMDTVEASKVDRLPVRGSASKVLEDVAVPEGAAQRMGTTYVSNAVFLDGAINIHFAHCMLDGAINIFTSLIAGLAICFHASACRLRPWQLPAEVHGGELSRGGGDGCCTKMQC